MKRIDVVDQEDMNCCYILDNPDAIFVIDLEHRDFNNWELTPKASYYDDPDNKRTSYYNFVYTGSSQDMFCGTNNRYIWFGEHNVLFDIRKVTGVLPNKVSGWGYRYNNKYFDWLKRNLENLQPYKYAPEPGRKLIFKCQAETQLDKFMEF